MSLSLDTAALQALSFSGETLLFPHSYAARLWRARLSGHLERPSGSTPLLAWVEWTTSLWSALLLQGDEDRLLLNRLQEEQVWTDVIAEASEVTPPASTLRDLASLARAAFQTAATYRMPQTLLPFADTVDARSFAHWLELFSKRLEQDRLLPSALLDDNLSQPVRAGLLQLPRRMHLVGFEQFTPAQEHLLAAVTAAGTETIRHSLYEPASAQSGRHALTVADSREQHEAAMQLLVSEIASRKQTFPNAPPPRLALVCPNPESHRQELERLFRQYLTPELEPVGADLSSTPWTFAAPASLTSLPAVADALTLLGWILEPLSTERIHNLLLSPSFTFADPPEVRARFDVTARSLPALRGALDLAGFARLLTRPVSEADSVQGSAMPRATFPELQEVARRAGDLAPSRSAADWSERIRKLLESVGWPGQRAQSAAEFKAMQAWDSVLDLLATLNFDSHPLSFPTFLALLAREASAAPLPATRMDVPLQVLSPQQAEALTFDLTLYLDATEASLPGPMPRFPLLPQTLGKSLGLSDSSRHLASTRHSLQSLADRSARIVLLAAMEGAEGEQAALTPLAVDLGFTSLQHSAPAAEDALIATETIADAAVIPLNSSEAIRGGSDILSQQAACGFRAFATYRLGARQERPAEIGVAAREGGNVLHSALQFLWQQLGSQAALRQLTPEERQALVQQATAHAMQKHHLRAAPNDRWSNTYLQIVRQRFVRLLQRWLDEELTRTPFAIQALEEQQELALGPLRLKLRTDRIDNVAGGQIFVDYKSSASLAGTHWIGPRPDAPQLPAYALGADPDTLKDIAFAKVRPGPKMGWVSLTGAIGHPQRRKKEVDLPAQLAAWHDELTSLASAFAEGRAEVNPKSYPQTCQYCDHRLLCRLNPAELLVSDEEDNPLEEDALG